MCRSSAHGFNVGTEKVSLSVDSLLNTLPDGVILLDDQGQVVYLNPKFTELTGFDLDDFTGLSYGQIAKFLIADEKLSEAQVQRFLAELKPGQPVTSTRKFRHKDDYMIPVDVTIYPVCDRSEQPRGTLIVCKDLHSKLMAKISTLVNSSLQLNEVLDNTTGAVVDYLGLSSCAIFLLDEKQQTLKLSACNVFKPDDLAKVVVPVGTGAPGLIAKYKKPVYVANLRTDRLINEFARTVHDDKSSIGYPLLCRERLLGVIAFDAQTVRPFSVQEQSLFESIAGQVAMAIYNSLLFSRLEHLSITDGLTGLYNHRYFQDRLVEELDRAKRNGNSCSLLMMDVDHFKQYNDCLGHPTGDKLLAVLSNIIRENIRSFDVPCRYGGEEFSVIMPDCPMEGALSVAERIRTACETFNFPSVKKLPSGKVTISIGVATYPLAQTKNDLISNADQALYAAKYERNCVRCAYS